MAYIEYIEYMEYVEYVEYMCYMYRYTARDPIPCPSAAAALT